MPMMDEDEMDEMHIDVMDAYHRQQHQSPSSSPRRQLGCASERITDTILAYERGSDNKFGELDSNGNCSRLPALQVAKDEMHTPKWGRKVQREFEAKNAGPPSKNIKRERASIVISGDEKDDWMDPAFPRPKGPMNDTSRIRGSKPEVPLRKEDAATERMDDEPSTLDLWGDLVKDRPEHWDIRDALMHGKTESLEDPSKDRLQLQRDESPKKAEIRCQELEGEPPLRETKIYIDARKWEGIDLNQAVDKEALTVGQAFSTMRLRKNIGKPEASRTENDEDDAPAEGRESEEELIEDL